MATNKILSFNASTGEMTETIVPFVLPDVAALKEQKKAEIEAACAAEINNGTELGLLSSLGYRVYDAKEDLGNYQVALAAMQAQGLTERTIKVKDPVDPFKTVTETQLQIILGELAVQGDNLFLKKFTLKGQADAITQEAYEAAYAAGVATAQAAVVAAAALPETTDEEKAAKADAVAAAAAALEVAELKTDYLFETIVW